MEDGGRFTGIGDASPDNVGRTIAPHIIRMAETRAKARALRDAVNIGVTALEELGEDVEEDSPRGVSTNRSPHALAPPEPVEEANEQADNSSEDKRTPETTEVSSIQKQETTRKAHKSQLDLLRTLAEELRGENGVERLEGRIGKPLTKLTRAEAGEWIDRLTPAEGS